MTPTVPRGPLGPVVAKLRNGVQRLSKVPKRTSATYNSFASDLRRGANRLQASKIDSADKLRWMVAGAAAATGAMTLGHLAHEYFDSDETEPPAESKPPAPESLPIESELDETVLRYADMSPFLREQLKKLKAEGWQIGYGDADAAGAVDDKPAALNGLTRYSTKQIVIDNDLKGDPLQATATLAHEVGHAYSGAFRAIIDPPTPGEEYSAWLERNMRMRYLAEAESELINARVRQEVMDHGGPDIKGLDKTTEYLYEQQRTGKLSHDKARAALADVMSTRPHEFYLSRLEKIWDEHYAQSHGPSEQKNEKPPLPAPPGHSDSNPVVVPPDGKSTGMVGGYVGSAPPDGPPATYKPPTPETP
ncbi:hypothetical protein [Nocardia paucivorans]|uniref:hypothetical protein n=1 Tax=Nocardia paucivorans TaxID=114259 RepID=UPI0012FA7BAB|nr:hypothetical protein [Nocardia paucivorans]